MRTRSPYFALLMLLALGAPAPVDAARKTSPQVVPPQAGVWEALLPLGYVRWELKRARFPRVVGVERYHSCKGGVVDVVGKGAPGIVKRRFSSRSAGITGRFLTGRTAIVDLRDPCSRQDIRVVAHRVRKTVRVLRGVYVGADAGGAPVQLRIWDPAGRPGAGADCGRGQRLCRVEVTLQPVVCAPAVAPLGRRVPVGPVGADGAIRLVGQGFANAAPTILTATLAGTQVSGEVTVAGGCGEFVVPFTASLTQPGQEAAAAATPGT